MFSLFALAFIQSFSCIYFLVQCVSTNFISVVMSNMVFRHKHKNSLYMNSHPYILGGKQFRKILHVAITHKLTFIIFAKNGLMNFFTPSCNIIKSQTNIIRVEGDGSENMFSLPVWKVIFLRNFPFHKFYMGLGSSRNDTEATLRCLACILIRVKRISTRCGPLS